MMLRNLILLLALPFGLSAQVGVNTDTPKQALDVNGKLQIGDDDTPPTPGTLRFDGVNGDFHGYDGAAWTSLTKNRSTGASMAPGRLITAYSSNISPDSEVRVAFDVRADNSQMATPGPGEYFLITAINVIPNQFTFSAERYALSFTVSDAPNSGYGDIDNSFRMTGNLAEQNFVTSETPILVVGPGQYLRVEASSLNQASVNLNLRGYWVDSKDL